MPTTEELFTEILDDHQGNATLTDEGFTGTSYSNFVENLKSNPSKVDDYGFFTYMIAVFYWLKWKLFEQYKEEVYARAQRSYYAQADWWIDRLYEFQYGDALVIEKVDGLKTISYEVIDPDKQIIKRSAIVNNPKGGSTFKLAGLDGSDNLIALNNDQLNAIKSYVNSIAPAGSVITLSSKNADLAEYYIRVYFNPIYDRQGILDTIIEAIENYHASLSTISLNGSTDLRKLEDKIQAIPGIRTFVIDKAIAFENGSNTKVVYDPTYITQSGYIKLNPAVNPEDTIQMIAVP